MMDIKKRENLKTKRLEKGLTQDQLSKIVGVSKEQIKSLEYGRVNPSFNLMIKICTALNSKVEELF